MKMKEYHVDMVACTLPVVISVFEEIGFPAKILSVSNEAQRGPLIATLSAQLAAVMAVLIRDSMMDGSAAEESCDFLEIRGFSKRKIDKEIQGKLTRSGVDLKSALVELRALMQRWSGARNLDRLRREYSRIQELDKLVQDARVRLSAELERVRRGICSEPDFESEYVDFLRSRGIDRRGDIDDLSERRISINFHLAGEKVGGGVVDILPKTEPKWWQRFAEKVIQEINKNADKRHVKMMFRDLSVIRLVADYAERENVKINEAWCEVLKNPSKYDPWILWPPYLGKSGSLNDDDIRGWFRDLRKEDDVTSDWLERHGGAFHPALRLKRFGWCIKAVKVSDIDRVENELHFCLTNGTGVEFAPSLSVAYPKEVWDAWVELAQARGPDYWVRCQEK